jgi:hypothetical protein
VLVFVHYLCEWCGYDSKCLFSHAKSCGNILLARFLKRVYVTLPMQIVAKEGPMGLYAGFIPIWSRFAPTTTLQLVMFEQLKPFFGATKGGE